MYNRSGAGSLFGYYADVEQFTVSAQDKAIVREYAKKVRELAKSPEQQAKIALWKEHNSLRTKQPVVMCDPENGWNEIITQDSLECRSQLGRKLEWILKRELFWALEIRDDRPLESNFFVPFIVKEGNWGLKIDIVNDSGGGFHWNPPLNDYAQLPLLKHPRIEIGHAKSDMLLDSVSDALGDILNVERKHVWWWSLATENGMCDALVFLRGLTNMMMDMYDHPDELHAIMAFIRDANLARLDYLQENKLLFNNNDETYVCSGGYGYSDEIGAAPGAAVSPSDMWGFSESQVTSEVSPAMFEEFIFPYQLPLMERFGLVGYGCCEGLDKRWHIVSKIPRLRRVSVSHWADHDKMEELLQDKYIYSSKPNPSPLALPQLDKREIRAWAKNEVKRANNCVLEIIMKDNHTLGNNPSNIVDWCEIVKSEIS